ncbi:NUDIX domain-containing protein [Glycomyces buryatensis]|uniref:NUDIX domain-containing protein n=1 Tax=Glycomyces buryatensis TaxID=2570927 RepID=A0A4V4HQF8_9ACTN|nr:NUDIX domain-containing protein [Glycomyces buryatensis]THV33626.1 NUDIX domain-containing protein [Glycomyces buryatensis]
MTDQQAAIGLARLADIIRAEAANGLYWGGTDDDMARMRQLRQSATELMALVDHRSADEIQAIFDTDLFLRTPMPATEIRIACSDGETVVRRRRLRWEEPSLGQSLNSLAEALDADVDSQPQGIADTDLAGLPCPHTFLLAYGATTPLTSEEVEAILEPGDRDLAGELEFLAPGESAIEREPSPLPVAAVVKRILDQVADLAKEGLKITESFYERERYERIEALCANTFEAEIDYPSVDCGDLAVVGLSTGADAAIFNEEGRLLLIRRTDTGQWAMPGGGAEVGETVALAAVREAAEESGLDVTITGLVWAFDKRENNLGDSRMPMIMSFQARVNDPDQPIRLAELEASDHRWITEDEWNTIDFFKGHQLRVPEAFAAYRR